MRYYSAFRFHCINIKILFSVKSHNTGTSHWLDPRLSKFQKKALEDCLDDELPYGWEKIHDPQYGTYFIDHVNRRTQYENPVLEAKRRCSEQQQEKQNLKNDEQFIDPNKKKIIPQSINRDSSTKHFFFTKNPDELRGQRFTTTLLKSSRGLGFTIVGGDDNIEEFLQIKSIVSNGPAWLDGKLQTGDILVYVNDTCVLGFTHHEMVNVFQSILPGETVTLDVCRGYPLPFDPNDPNTEVVTTVAVDILNSETDKARILMDFNMDGNYNFLDVTDSSPLFASSIQHCALNKFASNSSHISENYANETRRNFSSHRNVHIDKPEILTISIIKGTLGFGFTIADSAYGQKVKEILDRDCCKNLQIGDYLLAINNISVLYMSHSAVVQVLKNCPKNEEAVLKIQRGTLFNGNINEKLNLYSSKRSEGNDNVQEVLKDNLYRSKTPTADLYSTQPKEILPTRAKTPLFDTRGRVKAPSVEFNDHEKMEDEHTKRGVPSLSVDTKSVNSFPDQDSINNEVPYDDTFSRTMMSLSDRLADSHMFNQHQRLISDQSLYRSNSKEDNTVHSYGAVAQQRLNSFEQNSVSSDYYINYHPNVNLGNTYNNSPSNSVYAMSSNRLHAKSPIIAPIPTYHHDHCYCYECRDYGQNKQEFMSQIQKQNQYLSQQQKAQYPRGVYVEENNGFSPVEENRQSNNSLALSQQFDSNYWINSNQVDFYLNIYLEN